MIKSIVSIAVFTTAAFTTTVAASAAAAAKGATTPSSSSSGTATLNHISFTQPVGDGLTYVAGTNQTFSWTMACTPPSSLVSTTPSETEVDLMDSNNINNAFFVIKVGTIDCTKNVGNLVWTIPPDTKPGIYALQLLLTPNNAYSGRFNVTAPGGAGASGNSHTTPDGGNGGARTAGTEGVNSAPSHGGSMVTKAVAAAAIVGAISFAL